MDARRIFEWLRQRRDGVGFLLLAVFVPVWYSLYTDHIWEDFFITFRHSRNLVEGHGLVYNPGERVHGFTSPLGTLLPSLTFWIAGSDSYAPALWMFRVISIVAFNAGGWLMFRKLRDASPNQPIIPYAFAVLYAFEAKSVAYSVNGMETGLLLFFVGWGMHLMLGQPPYRILQMGLCWAGLMWTRPDAFVPILALVIAHLVFFANGLRPAVAALGKSAALGAALYAPWLVGTTAYYGSPVPHTIKAKSNHALKAGVNDIAHRLYTNYPLRAAQTFAPIYFPNAWMKPGWIGRVSYILGVFCTIYWLFPVRDRLGRAASLCFFLMCIYFALMPFAFPWYLPPAALCGLVVLASGTATLLQSAIPKHGWRPGIQAAGLACIAVPIILLFGLNARLMRIQEKYVEMGNRVPLGRWLKDNVKSNETVFLEPLGYIGYFSQARMLDFPGLASPEVVKRIKARALNYPALIQDLQPDWVVMRPWELRATLAQTHQFTDQYQLQKTFDVTGRCARYMHLPGANYMKSDAVFHVYRRRAENLSEANNSMSTG